MTRNFQKMCGLVGLRPHRKWPIRRALAWSKLFFSTSRAWSPKGKQLELAGSRINGTLDRRTRRQFTRSLSPLSRYQGSPKVRRSAPQQSQSEHTSPHTSSNQASSRSSPNIVVGSVIGVCIAIWAGHVFVADKSQREDSERGARALKIFNQSFVLSLQNLKEGRYYTLLTSTLTHFSLPHLAVNMITLWSFGRIIVAYYGIPAFATLWIGSGIGGGILQSYFWLYDGKPNAAHQAIGASGSILGMVTVLSFVMPHFQVTVMVFPMPIWVAVAGVTTFSIAAIKEGWLPWLGHVDHLGGIAFGALWWLFAIRKGKLGRMPRRQ